MWTHIPADSICRSPGLPGVWQADPPPGNEDDGDVVKFAHFHFKGVHFKFMRNCPQTKEDIVKMIAFPKKELQKLSSKDIKDLLKLLHSSWDKNSSMTVYEACIAVWGTLHDREIDYID